MTQDDKTYESKSNWHESLPTSTKWRTADLFRISTLVLRSLPRLQHQKKTEPHIPIKPLQERPCAIQKVVHNNHGGYRTKFLVPQSSDSFCVRANTQARFVERVIGVFSERVARAVYPVMFYKPTQLLRDKTTGWRRFFLVMLSMPAGVAFIVLSMIKKRSGSLIREVWL